MEYFVDLIIGSSSTLDVFVLVRLIIFCLVLEFVGTIISALGGGRK